MKKNSCYHFILVALLFTAFAERLNAQSSKQMSSAEIYESLEKFNFLGNALYVAAHPDDENTRMIAYLANEVKANTAYLSLTRGGGGQNLIGTELKEMLGVLRTQELQMARKVDGGQQFFSRAIDFSFSKHPDETFAIWDKEKIMSDAVWVIRQFRPDIIINRFDHESAGRTHGHHTASALVSLEAFDMSGDSKIFADQLKYTDTWQASRLLFNTSWWFYGSRENFEKADRSQLLTVDVGAYYPLRGKSNNEIAAESRSNHRCQGFGSSGTRGSQIEYLKVLKGDIPKDKSNLFEGINTTWSRVKGGDKIQRYSDEILASFDFKNPSAILEQLLELYSMVESLEDDFWKKQKLPLLKKIITACAGLYLEFDAKNSSASPGDYVELDIECTNRSSLDIELKSFVLLPMNHDSMVNANIAANEAFKTKFRVRIPTDAPLTAPYWLSKQGSLGTYNVTDQELIGLPESPRYLKGEFSLKIGDHLFTVQKDVVHKYANPAVGEIFEPFEITPQAFINTTKPVYIFNGPTDEELRLVVVAGQDDISGELHLNLDPQWQATPSVASFEGLRKGEKKEFTFKIKPPKDQSVIQLNPTLMIDGRSYNQSVQYIDYDHIPKQTVLKVASTKLVRINLKKRGKNIAYIMGAGDKVPESLREMGYRVDELKPDACKLSTLQKYDAVVSGIRAYNTLEEIKFLQPTLMEYVEKGGTYIVQYNTNRRMKTSEIGPYPIKLSRDRVTVEEAEVRFLAPEHPILNSPNKIGPNDFEGWVSERGLYFANEWDDKYTPILSSNDPGESAKDGGMLVAEYGKGHFIFSGYSWFRELPAGVPGAYRIFANMVSYGIEEQRP